MLPSVPAPIKRVFDSFPLATHAAATLPLGGAPPADTNVLYTHTTPSAAAVGAPSFHPGCLKWQVRRAASVCAAGLWAALVVMRY